MLVAQDSSDDLPPIVRDDAQPDERNPDIKPSATADVVQMDVPWARTFDF